MKYTDLGWSSSFLQKVIRYQTKIINIAKCLCPVCVYSLPLKFDRTESEWESHIAKSYLSFASSSFNFCFGNQNKEIETIRLPVKNPKAQRGIAMESFPILHPHRVLSYLFDEVGITIPEDDVRRYWQHARSVQDPFAVNAPNTCTDSHIPLGMHGDAARLWTQVKFEKMVGVTMNIILFRPKSVRHSRFMLFTTPSEKLYKNRTLNCVWRRLCWSLDAAFQGYNPEKGPGGTPLAGGHLSRAGKPLTKGLHRFCLTEYRGDWEWHRDVWRPYASWVSQKVCFKCPAIAHGGDPSYLYHNTGGPNESECQWVREEYSLQRFVAHSLREKNLCNFAGFLNAFCFFMFFPYEDS